MTDLKKYTYSRIFSHAWFWLPVAPLYLVDRGLSIEQVFTIVSFYALLVVIFEYPSGVIADTFSHKKSVFLGGFLVATGFALNVVPGDFWYYICTFSISAFGSSLRSGSDTALLHTLSDNFKKDLVHIKSLALVSGTVAIVVGGFLYKAHIALPYAATAVFMFISAFITLSIKRDTEKNEASGNVYATTTIGIRYLRGHPTLKMLLIFSGAFLAFFYSLKWLVPSLLESLHFNIESLGIIMAAGMLLRAFSTKLSDSRYDVSLVYATPICILAIIAMGVVSQVYVVVTFILIVFFFRGFIDVHIITLINERIGDGIRASMLSLSTLTGRLLMSLYIFVSGKILGVYSWATLSIFTATLLSIVSLALLIVFTTQNKKQKPAT